jgi:hypothetical protein
VRSTAHKRLVFRAADGAEATAWVEGGAPDRASPKFMGLASLRLDISIFCDFLYSVFLLDAILGLDFLRLARPQVEGIRQNLAALVGRGVSTILILY